jgi:hypothetical protein
MHDAAERDGTWFPAETLARLATARLSMDARGRLEDAVDAGFDELVARIEPFLDGLQREATRLARGFRPPAADLRTWVLDELRAQLAAGDPFAPLEAALAEVLAPPVPGDGMTTRLVDRLVAVPDVQAGARLVADTMAAVAASRASGAQDGTGLLAGGAAAAAFPGFGPLFGALLSASPDGNAGGKMPDPQALRDLVRAGLLQVLTEAREGMLAEVSSPAQ